jgi:predicted transcriptional regulator
MSTTIRVSEGTRQRAADLAARTGSQMQVVVEKALVAYERSLFWEAFEDGYRRLADDAEAWDQIEAERRGEAPSLRDGVE